ncbi:MAG: hypothetical protein F4103_13735 [Boseongicola sp. SB0673_bin_14]|nr:hypothetical protein [Boseongicola sp. SB0673_bin_14]
MPGVKPNQGNPYHTLISRFRARVAINPYWDERSSVPTGWQKLDRALFTVLIVDLIQASNILQLALEESNDLNDTSGNDNKYASTQKPMLACERIIRIGFPTREIGTYPSDNDYRGVSYNIDGAQYDRTQTGVTENYPYLQVNPFSKNSAPIQQRLPYQPFSEDTRLNLVYWTVTNPHEEFQKKLIGPTQVVLYLIKAPLIYVPNSSSISNSPFNYFGVEIDVSGMYAPNLEDLIPYV